MIQKTQSRVLTLLLCCIVLRQVIAFTFHQGIHHGHHLETSSLTVAPFLTSTRRKRDSNVALRAFRFRRGAKPRRPASDEDPNTNDEAVVAEKITLDKVSSEKIAVEKISSSEEALREAIRAKSQKSSKRLRRLKDLVWVRETLEDLTAAEFACAVESGAIAGLVDAAKKQRRKRAVDYEKLLTQLNRRISDMGCDFASDPTRDTTFTCVLTPGVGSASQVYSGEQRQSLLEKLIRTRKSLIEVIQGYQIDMKNEEEISFELNLPDFGVEIPREVDELNDAGPKLYVREDGTVDWDGALQDQAALRNFGTAVWARINGRQPEPDGGETVNGDSLHGHGKEVVAKVAETPEIIEAREKMAVLKQTLAMMEIEHTGLLNSAIGAGQAVANVNLATLDSNLRSRIIASADELEKAREKVIFQTLLYELERIYTYLAGELGSPAMKGYISLQDRLNIAEFGLYESQTESFKRQLEIEESIDGDVLLVVQDQMNDFKRRLGIDYLVTGLTFDREAIARWLMDLFETTKKTLAFYGKGCRLFWNDLVFTVSLVTRAAQGYTLKPREVRTIRRTFKDILTFIPFVIILLIPLSPVGHVLVFGAIQRFFPDFFPSCFTEQRQNLLQLYETAEYSEFTIDEDWKAKLSRLVVAFAFFVTNISRSLYLLVSQFTQSKSHNNQEPPNGQP